MKWESWKKLLAFTSFCLQKFLWFDCHSFTHQILDYVCARLEIGCLPPSEINTICWAAKVRCKFLTHVPTDKGIDIFDFRLHPGHFDCTSTHDSARHCVYSRIHAYWLGNAFALKPVIHQAGFWGSIRTLACGYEISRIIGGQWKDRSSRNKV